MKQAKGKKKELSSKKGMTYLREIEIRYRKRPIKDSSATNKPIRGAKQIFQLFSDLQNATKEKLITISLDAKLKIICFEVVAMGAVKAIYIRPFEALRSSLPLNPEGIIIVHNHPSGDPKPSREDKKFTKTLKQLTDAGGLRLYDHIIIGEESYFSFAERGWL